MKPMEGIALFWYIQCREHNVCSNCHKKFVCKWAFEEIKKAGERWKKSLIDSSSFKL